MKIGYRFVRPLTVIAGLLCVLVALASYRFVPFGVADTMAFLAYQLPDNRWFLYAHIAIAPLSLMLLPLQLSSRFRAKYSKVHRWGGRLYVLLILVSGIAAIQLASSTEAGPLAGVGFGIVGVLWLIVTGLGFRSGLRRDFVAHRRWMLRSAALTFAAVTLRLYLGLTMAAGLPFGPSYTAIAWLCWVPNLFVIELYLRGSLRWKSRPLLAQ
ncbi:DUF2306 domain-containing protein [Roseibium algae]|uniref:DUF2306 domain-containing protein n=1 Tax=Roseibium algae TaxID=3123038 RepID=A0ABU8TRE5_9HYPH